MLRTLMNRVATRMPNQGLNAVAARNLSRNFSTEAAKTEKESVIETRYDDDETLIFKVNGEDIWVPDVSRSIEWVLDTPVDLHLFDECPVIKECPE